MSASHDILHVANGHSLTALIARAGIPGTLSVWSDVLHDGPVPGGISDEELMLVRARYLAGADGSPDEVLTELRGWEQAIERFSELGEIVLWFEHDLFDQLNLIQLLDRLAGKSRGSANVTLISIGSFPGRMTFKGMGELTPEELAPLFGTRQPVRDDQYELGRRAWAAFRSADPRAIEELLAGDTSALQFLAAALHRHLEEFPSVVNGLSRSENRLLELVAGGQTNIRSTFPQMHVGETAYYIGDLSYWDRARELAGLSPPLLQIAASDYESGLPAGLPAGEFAMTSDGRDVLRGAADRIKRWGIDRWMGGVRLSGTGPVWRWDPAAGRIVALEDEAHH
jgi:hypothetical protein